MQPMIGCCSLVLNGYSFDRKWWLRVNAGSLTIGPSMIVGVIGEQYCSIGCAGNCNVALCT